MNPDFGRSIALVVLLSTGVALLIAGVYGVFGKPTSHEGKQRKRHIVHGFQLGGGILLGIFLMGSLVTCSQIAFGIVDSERLSRTVAFLVALISLVLILSMIKHWAKHFAGWIGYGVLNGLNMTTTGHLVNNPSILVPRWWSISATALMFTSALVSVRFVKNYTLNAVDKGALMVWLLAFTFAVDVESTHAFYHGPVALSAMLIGTLALVAASVHDKSTRPRRIAVAAGLMRFDPPLRRTIK